MQPRGREKGSTFSPETLRSKPSSASLTSVTFCPAVAAVELGGDLDGQAHAFPIEGTCVKWNVRATQKPMPRLGVGLEVGEFFAQPFPHFGAERL